MKKRNKFAAWLMVSAMAAGALSGIMVQASEEGQSGILPLAEAETFTMFAGTGVIDTPYTENPAFMWACDNANVYFEIEHGTPADVEEQKNLLLGSGDYPEVFYKASLGDGYTYGSEGIFIPLEDLIREYAPNLCAILDKENGWSYITAADGHVYTLPEMQGASMRGLRCLINEQWIANLGLEMPTDLDSFYNVLKAFKEQDANGNGDPDDEIPIAFSDITSPIYLLQYFGYNLYDYQYNFYSLDENGEPYYIAADEEYKEYINFLKKLYDEGLCNENLFTLDLNELKAQSKNSEETILGVFWDYQPAEYVNTLDQKNEYGHLMPFTEGTLSTSIGYVPGTFAITDKCSNPAAVLAWVDQYYSDEGSVVAFYGLDGSTYEWVDEESWDYIYDEEGNAVRSNKLVVQGDLNHPASDAYIEFSKKFAQTDKFTEQYNVMVDMGATPWPNVVYTEEEEKIVADPLVNLYNYRQEYLANVVTGKMDLESTWEEYLAKLSDMGLEQVVETFITAYNRAK